MTREELKAASRAELESNREYVKGLVAGEFNARPMTTEERLKLDRLLFGESFKRVNPDGTEERIDPATVVRATNNPLSITTQAKYFYHFEAVSDGQRATETIGFQTHRELIEYMIAVENDGEKRMHLAGLLADYTNFTPTNETLADSPQIK